MFLHSGDEMELLKHSDSRKYSTSQALLFMVARGRCRFLVRSSLAGSFILWIVLSGVFMIRGMFHGLAVPYVVLLEAVSLLIVFPFGLALAFYQWKKFQKMAAMDGLSVGAQ
ncbi:MAG TPA: hypothetical protein VFK06_06400 [Candidatus Angelobacter sp.]|nr:hypothetical protein [Candidatus Angelobacter sp.]